MYLTGFNTPITFGRITVLQDKGGTYLSNLQDCISTFISYSQSAVVLPIGPIVLSIIDPLSGNFPNHSYYSKTSEHASKLILP